MYERIFECQFLWDYTALKNMQYVPKSINLL